MNDAIFELRGITKHFVMGEVEVKVLRGIDLDVPKARVTVLLGPSGSGKTTLLNVIGGIDRPTAGTAKFEGRDLAVLTDRELTQYRREHVGYVFQFYNLVPALTAIENVQVATELTDAPLDPREMLELVDLTDRTDHFPAQLSGGEQQRVAIARALAKDPDLLLCDEPTGALDKDTGRMVLGLLRHVADEMQKTVIIVTHNSAIAKMADRVVLLGSGVLEHTEDHETVTPAEEITW